MLFKKIKDINGMYMDVTRLEIPYKDIVKILGPSHINYKNYQKFNMSREEFIATWLFSFCDIPFKIEYDARKWSNKEKPSNEFKLENEKNGFIVGHTEMIKKIIINILKKQTNNLVTSYEVYFIIKQIFLGMEEYK